MRPLWKILGGPATDKTTLTGNQNRMADCRSFATRFLVCYSADLGWETQPFERVVNRNGSEQSTFSRVLFKACQIL